MKKNRGMIRIIEAFAMVMLIIGLLLIFLSQEGEKRDFGPNNIYEIEQEILREIQLNETLREEIISQNSLPVTWENMPEIIRNKIISETPSNLNCQAKICNLNDDCFFDETSDSSLYTQRTIISSSLNEYDPKKIKIFCQEK